MTGAEHGTGRTAARADAPAPGTAAAADAAAAPTAGMTDSPAPLTSLTSLLGGTIEGGTSCAADGTCD